MQTIRKRSTHRHPWFHSSMSSFASSARLIPRPGSRWPPLLPFGKTSPCTKLSPCRKLSPSRVASTRSQGRPNPAPSRHHQPTTIRRLPAYPSWYSKSPAPTAVYYRCPGCVNADRQQCSNPAEFVLRGDDTRYSPLARRYCCRVTTLLCDAGRAPRACFSSLPTTRYWVPLRCALT